jgi:hypothetical protein
MNEDEPIDYLEEDDLAENELSEIMRHLSTLQYLAQSGDFAAVEAIVKTGNHAALMLHYIFACCHPLQRIHRAATAVCEHSERWPVSIPAITEIREAAISETLPENLGSALAISPKPKGRKGRSLTKPGETRLALDVHEMLEARRMKRQCFAFGEPWESMAIKLKPLTRDTAPSWVNVGLVLVASDYERKDDLKFLRTRELISAVKRCETRDTLSFKSAFTKTCKQWLKTGFRQLVEV